MKLTTCFESHLIDDDLWALSFYIEEVSSDFVEKAKEADGEWYYPGCFWFRVYYEEIEDALPDMRCDLMYILSDGIDIEMDYHLSDKEKKCLLEKIRREIK